MSITKYKKQYDDQGFAILPDQLPKEDLKKVKHVLSQMCQARLLSLGIETDAQQDIDSLLLLILKNSPDSVRELIIAFRDHSCWYELLVNQNLQTIAREMLGCEELMIVHDSCMLRIDPQQDEKRLLKWHQEFPYILKSDPGLTLWIPLTDIDQDMGPMQIIPESHHEVIPVKLSKADKILNAIEPLSEDLSDNEDIFSPSVNGGDVVALHGYTIHKSGQNKNPNKARWVIVIRYGDMFCPNLVKTGWDVSRDKRSALSVLQDRFPNLVAK